MTSLLNPKEVAEMLGVKPSTIYQWTHTGYIPHMKLGKLVRFRLQDIERWLEEKATQGRLSHKVDIRDLGL